MKLLNYVEISNKYNINLDILKKRVNKLKLKGTFKNRIIHFNQEQIWAILNCSINLVNNNYKYSKRKLLIAELLLQNYTINYIMINFNISYDSVKRVYDELNNDNCVIVESNFLNLK